MKYLKLKKTGEIIQEIDDDTAELVPRENNETRGDLVTELNDIEMLGIDLSLIELTNE